MNSPLAVAFAHHTWASLRLISACRELSPAQLESPVPGVYGSLLAMLEHYLLNDSFYLSVANGGESRAAPEARMDLDQLGTLAEETGRGWAALLMEDLDPDLIRREVDPTDGFTRDAPLGIQLAEQLHHAHEHREQCRLAFAALGFEPPDLSGWAFGAETGLVEEVGPDEG